MQNIFSDPILAHHLRAIKMVQDSLRVSDCCRRPMEDAHDLEIYRGCGEPCSDEQ